jgi:hypothetical protein
VSRTSNIAFSNEYNQQNRSRRSSSRFEGNALGQAHHDRAACVVPAQGRIMKLMKPGPVVKATVELGYPESVIMGLGIVLLVCVILYVVPCTAVLGAILLTGYLGGAIATHVRVGNPLFSHVLFPVYLGVLIWGGLISARSAPSRVHSNTSWCK